MGESSVSIVRGFSRLASEALYREQATIRYHALEKKGWEGIYLCKASKAERDDYDIESTFYLAAFDDAGMAGCLRLCRTDVEYWVGDARRTFMMQDVFLRHCGGEERPLATGRSVFEASRLCVRSELEGNENRLQRRRCVRSLLIAAVEHCLSNKIEYLYGVMPNRIYDSTWGSVGYQPLWLGDEFLDKGDWCRAARKTMSHQLLERLRSEHPAEVVLNYIC